MASLQKIRNHGVLLVVIVGLAMLAFILGDFFNSGSSYFNRSAQYVGTIEGEDIHYQDYEKYREQLAEFFKAQYNTSDVDDEMQGYINNQAWELIKLEYILSKQTNSIGMSVTADELYDMCGGTYVHPFLQQCRLFAGQDGQFNYSMLQQIIYLSEHMDEFGYSQDLQKMQDYWNSCKKQVYLYQLQQKYQNLLKELVGANNLEAEFSGKIAQTDVNVDYVMQPYFTVTDSLTVGDNELKALYNKRKDNYKQEPYRSLKYVVIKAVPSQEDYQEVYNEMLSLQEEFTTTNEIAEVVNPNSEVLYTGYNYSQNTIPAQYKDWAFEKGRKAGDVTEIILENDVYSMARIVETGYSLPDSVELRGAVIAKEDLDSLQQEWKKNNFGDATQTQWLTEAQVTREIADQAFTGAKGSMFTLPYGTDDNYVQVIQIVDKTVATPKVKMAILANAVRRSDKTYNSYYGQAAQFANSCTNEESFIQSAEEQGLEVENAYRLDKNAARVGNIAQSRQVVKWANGAKLGQVSQVFECGDDNIVVAVLTEINKNDYSTFDEVKAYLREEVLNDKRAEVLINKFNGITSLEQAAQLAETEIKSATNVTFNTIRFGTSGNEPAVVGAALHLNAGELSAPIKGQQGVYIVKSESKATTEGEVNIEQGVQNLNMNLYAVPNQALQLIVEKAEVTDNRYKFY